MSDSFEGVVSLRWYVQHKCADHSHHIIGGALVIITDVETGQSITSATDVKIHAPLRGSMTAELTMLTNRDGRPLGNDEKPSLGEDGKPRTGVFRFLVADLSAVSRERWPVVGEKAHYVPAGGAACQESVIDSLGKCPRDTEASLDLGNGVLVQAGRDERYAKPPVVWDEDYSGYPARSWHAAHKCEVPSLEGAT